MSNYYLCADCGHRRQLFAGIGKVDCRVLPRVDDAKVMHDGGPGVGYPDPLVVCPFYEPRRRRYEKPRVASSLEGLMGGEGA